MGLSGLVAAIGLLVVSFVVPRFTCSEPYRADTYVKFPNVSYAAEVVDTVPTRQKGLSGRKCIPAGQGMLFSFDEAGKHGFWMQDMHFAIDIIWLDNDLKVVTVENGVLPSTYPHIYFPTENARYALELKAGQASSHGVVIGSTAQF